METYTHGHHESVLRSHRWRTAENSAAYLLPHLNTEQRLLDVGAGPGTITLDLADRVASVTATEIGETELDLSREAARSRGVTNIDFRVEDVHALSIDDDAYDVVHAHQVLQHVADPVQALREMRRVTKPGGVVAVRESDYAGFVWWPESAELTEWLRLYQQTARANGGEPDAGRRLHSWARAAGFTEVESTSSTWCFADAHDRAWWGGLWADRFTDSAIARQLVDSGDATTADLARVADGWRSWADAEDGWFSVLHGEIIARA
ncbi:methyltransferase family protein [Nocardioides albertanoniae]|uniref:Methyltransferase family protein n=1 Tax=Nocardioides albertanoniae TaxID=1175486 RepID=A0A543A7L9_9ACTN|nr:class I SAM-dependent methyltransferase [Nocardioides albertanoniae]TQL68601.1 methyltransferase family protein [Nocardioides albertanoniae]